MITQFIRNRNINTALPFSKAFARVQVRGSTKTFKFIKKVVPSTEGRLLTESDDILNTEASERIIIG